MEIGDQELCFLDVKISIVGNKLETTVYSKPTDSHLYLHASSCHAKSSINGIPKGVSLRLRRLCSTDAEYDLKSADYKEYLAVRGYNEKTVEKEFSKIKSISRQKAREPKKRENSSSVIFTTKFNPRGPNVRDIVKKHLPIIQNAPSLRDVFKDKPILVANKRESNLSNLLLRSDPYKVKPDLLNKESFGYKSCGKRKCDSCQNFVIKTTSIKSFATGRVFQIRRPSTCSTPNVIYVAICQTCGKQGVGSTVAWKPRLSNYKSHIKHKRQTCKIVTHFTDECVADGKNLKFVIVDVVNNAELIDGENLESLLLKKEKFWIGTLVTQHRGLNGSHDWNRKLRTEKEKT